MSLKLIFSGFSVFFITHIVFAQQITEDRLNNTIEYIDKPQSFQSKLIYKSMAILKMNKKLEEDIQQNNLTKEAADIPKSFFRKYDIQIIEQDNRKVWEIKRKNNESDLVVLYLHGGAYYTNLNSQHWLLIEQLILTTNAIVIVPDYPLAPEANCLDVFQFIDTVYAKLLMTYPDKRIVLMGDSAGGGLALGFAQKIKNEEIKQPNEIILFSPWLDVTMSNQDILNFENDDKILSVNGLKFAGMKYAGDLLLTDYRVSPIYGKFNGLARITIFIGTKDILIADARKCKLILEEQNSRFNYYEYKDMFHDWVIISSLAEAKDVIDKVSDIVKQKR